MDTVTILNLFDVSQINLHGTVVGTVTTLNALSYIAEDILSPDSKEAAD
jgi:hypothetical protein